MPDSVAGGFDAFHSRLTPTATESTSAASHRKSIEACLKNNFDMTGFFRTGSFGHGTSIRGFSDVDYFAVLPASRLTQNSETSLRNVRDALAARFPGTGVCVRTPAVVVPFGNDASETTEVIPADDVGRTAMGERIYDIPNRYGAWMRASPSAHNAYVNKLNKSLHGKVKPLIRFAKAWKYYRNVPVRSFYLELRSAAFVAKDPAIIYSIDVERFFRHLQGIRFAKMRDPVDVSGMIAGFATDPQVEDAQSKLTTAAIRATNARHAEKAGKIREAFDWWDRVFDGHFPAYG